MEEETVKKEIIIITIGCRGSFLSDAQTFGFICLSFIANYHLAGNNGWLSFLLFLMAIAWLFGRVKASEKIKKFKTVTEAKVFLETLEEK